VAGLNELGEDAVEQLEFTTRAEDVVAHVIGLQVVQEQVRVIADLTQLHNGVAQRHLPQLACRGVSRELPVLLDPIVHYPLPCTKIDLNDHLNFIRQLLLNLALHSPEQEWPEHLMQSIDNKQLLLLAQLECLFLLLLIRSHRMHLTEWLVKPLLEFIT
jgi:hypothetical protein